MRHGVGVAFVGVAVGCGTVDGRAVEGLPFGAEACIRPMLDACYGDPSLGYAGDLVVTSHAGMQAFCDAGYQFVVGNLIVDAAVAVTDLDELSCLCGVEGSVLIHNNATVSNVDGLGGLVHVGGDFEIYNDSGMIDIDGAREVRLVGGDIRIDTTSSIAAFDLGRTTPFAELVFLRGDLVLTRSSSIGALGGFGTLRTVGGSVVIESSSALSNIDGMPWLMKVAGDVSITGNPVLPTATAEAFAAGIPVVRGAITVSGNGP